MLGRGRTHKNGSRRRIAASLALVGLLSALVPQVASAAAPDVREVTPAGIVINGSQSDWDSPSADFLTNMFEAGDPTKRILARAYGRYDCGTQTFYILVVSITGWTILPSNGDNYVKLGQTDVLVNGASGANGTPPDFTYIQATAWEASFSLAPGSYLGDGGLNIHAEVVPTARASTAAPAGRRMDAIIDCSTPTPTPSPTPTPPPTASPTPTPTGPDPTPTPTPTPDPTPSPTPTPEPTPSPTPTPEPTPSPTPTPEPTPSPTPTPLPTTSIPPTPVPTPTGTPEPPVDPPLIIAKVNDQGTPQLSDDRIVGGARFEVRQDDGDGTYEPAADDAPVLADLEATHGFAVFTPPGSGDYWVTEAEAPPGLEIAPPQLVTYTIPAAPRNCGIQLGRTTCVPDEDQSGGYVILAVMDSPIGGIAPATADPTLPRTDTGSAIADRGNGGLWLVIVGLLSMSAGLLLHTSRRRSPARVMMPAPRQRRRGPRSPRS